MQALDIPTFRRWLKAKIWALVKSLANHPLILVDAGVHPTDLMGLMWERSRNSLTDRRQHEQGLAQVVPSRSLPPSSSSQSPVKPEEHPEPPFLQKQVLWKKKSSVSQDKWRGFLNLMILPKQNQALLQDSQPSARSEGYFLANSHLRKPQPEALHVPLPSHFLSCKKLRIIPEFSYLKKKKKAELLRFEVSKFRRAWSLRLQRSNSGLPAGQVSENEELPKIVTENGKV